MNKEGKTPEDLKKDIQEQIEKTKKQDIGLDADSSSLENETFFKDDDPNGEVMRKPFNSPLDEK